MTQKQLATKCGMSQSYISDLELGKLSPTLETMELISNKLNTSICYFIEHEE